MNWRLPRFPIDEDAPYLHRVIGQTAPLLTWAALLYAIQGVVQTVMQLVSFIASWLRWIFLVLVLVTPASAADFWTEDWEPYTVGANCFLNSTWNLAVAQPFQNPNIASQSVDGAFGPFSGSKMCHGAYNGGGNADFADRSFGVETGEVWGRFMHRKTGQGGVGNFQYSNISNKIMMFRNDASQPNEGDYSNFWLEHTGDGSLQYQNQATFVTPHPTLFSNVNPIIPLTDPTHWYCVETHILAGTAGNADGLVEAWVDGQKQICYGTACGNGTSIAIVGAAQNPNVMFSALRLWVQLGVGEGYFDKMTFGTTRIGGNSYAACTGGGGGGGTPPNAPTNLIVHGMILLALAFGLARVTHGSLV